MQTPVGESGWEIASSFFDELVRDPGLKKHGGRFPGVNSILYFLLRSYLQNGERKSWSFDSQRHIQQD